jgi:hypothetical protein
LGLRLEARLRENPRFGLQPTLGNGACACAWARSPSAPRPRAAPLSAGPELELPLALRSLSWPHRRLACGVGAAPAVARQYPRAPLPLVRPLAPSPAGARLRAPGVRARFEPRWPLPRPRRTGLHRRSERPRAKPLSRWATRRPARASGSASSARRWFPQRGRPGGTSSSATPRRKRRAPACPSSRGRRPSPPEARGERPGCCPGWRRSSGGRNRRPQRRKARSQIRRWCAGGWSTRRRGEGRRKRSDPGRERV